VLGFHRLSAASFCLFSLLSLLTPGFAFALGKRPISGIAASEIGEAFATLSDLDPESLSSGRWILRSRMELAGEVSTYHPQGVKALGNSLYVTSVEGKNEGRGHLLRYELEGLEKANLSGHLVLGTFPNLPTSFNHAGGLDGNTEALYVPLAEYRKKGASRILKIDLSSFTWKPLGRLPTHAGAVAYDADFASFRIVGWGGGFTTIPFDGTGSLSDQTSIRREVSTGSWQYQDCKSIGEGEAICSAKKGTLLPTGEIHLVRFKEEDALHEPNSGPRVPFEIIHRIRVPKLKPNGKTGGRRPLSYNGMDVVPVRDDSNGGKDSGRIHALRFFFLPHDGTKSRLFVFDARIR
jgi:hypothetical protein